MSVFDPSLDRNPIWPSLRRRTRDGDAPARHPRRARRRRRRGPPARRGPKLDPQARPQLERIAAAAQDARVADRPDLRRRPPSRDPAGNRRRPDDRPSAPPLRRGRGGSGNRLPGGDGPGPAVAAAARAGVADAGAREPRRRGARTPDGAVALAAAARAGRDRLPGDRRAAGTARRRRRGSPPRRWTRPASGWRAPSPTGSTAASRSSAALDGRHPGHAALPRLDRGGGGAGARDRAAALAASASCWPRTTRPTRWSPRRCCARSTPRCWSAATASRRSSGSTASPADLVVVDIEMPRLTGLDVIRAIRARTDAKAHVPIVALTAYAMREHRDRIAAAGANGLIAKPITSIEALGRALAAYVRSAPGRGGRPRRRAGGGRRLAGDRHGGLRRALPRDRPRARRRADGEGGRRPRRRPRQARRRARPVRPRRRSRRPRTS